MLASPRSCWPCLPPQSQSGHLQAGADRGLMETRLPCTDQGPGGHWAVLQLWGRLQTTPHSLWPGQGCAPG